ncbi:outer membrane protein assembly factor BamA [Aminobacter anthyllidis]|uniref:outer membrane protein assembly factor BamA n=1 Tax=Aminobacter anthyllidis TaxID=1035067 RepID=UPI0024582019|nr:outer membrane protein assembly factor BamA [Aminobacter anthyllidis]MDH4984549.1 outer membrane protein assembly factor BamA [Aminobacter anthyllidis]
MKAASKFASAASAVALSAALAIPGAVAVQFVAVSAAQAAVVNRVEVRGNQRVDADTVRNYITIKPGKSFSNTDIDDAVKALFGSGLFSDVRINQVGSTLVVQVSEYQVVNNVLFQGNKKLKDAALGGAVQLKPRGAFSQATMESDAQAIKDAYKRVGRDDVTVGTKVMDLGENRVNVVFEINEGGRTKIAAINFVGNDAYGDRRLADIISTKRSSFLSFMLRDDIYDEDRLRADEEALRRFYFNHGYADFQVVSAFGELDEATNQYTITITVDEGQRYTFGDVTVESSIPEVDGASLQRLVETRKGDVYNAKDVEDSIIAITENVAGAGYAFAKVTPRGDRNFETRTISVAYTVDQGAKAYVERIEIRGNERTRDFVIRREFDVSEGDAFNQVLIQRAKKRLEALNFFERVEVSTAPGSQPDQVVLVVDLVEKSTGEFSIGAGYSTGGDNAGPSVEGSITERNFLGRGQFIKFSAGGGKNSRDYSFSFTEPYFLGRRIAAGFDVFRQTRKYDDKYDSDVTGGTIRFGLPITNNISTQLAYNLSQEKYELNEKCDTDGNGIPDASCSVSPAIIDGIANSPWIKSSVSGTLVYNTIDDMKNPHNGIYANFTTEVAGLGGDAKFVKFTGRASYYQTLSEELDIVGLVSAGAGHIQGFGDDGLRVFDHFKNNDRMIRGFEYNGIGPYDKNGGDHLGGTTYFNASAEAQFPIPVVPESFGLRGAVFADAATLYGSKVDVVGTNIVSTDMELRASVGIGLLWASPFGPLRIDYAVPVKKLDTDNTQEFNFGISTRF